ncbi:hypothetical protein [Sebaldella sp. S0638]|uniref:hypothetical protein n=1 Tax=Sebaldella sp. S0638 TaxID=2957809 RepID=UPI00209F28B0|nr:hypothetical protein [Sebaldella sp. S0638]MCP1226634.1 hypothetical protein [Sebaldella sp. S0638]
MDIIIKENIENNFTDKNVRWYLSDGSIWIGLEKTYKEIEKRIPESYGSFIWLNNGADTLLFDKMNALFSTGLLNVIEPINLESSVFNNDIDCVTGTIEIVKKEYCYLTFESEITYDINQDALISCPENNLRDNSIIVVKLTNDFNFIVKENKLVGWILRNASQHIRVAENNTIEYGLDVENLNLLRACLVKYIKGINKLDTDFLTEALEDLRSLYEELKLNNLAQINMIKESILGILDFYD